MGDADWLYENGLTSKHGGVLTEIDFNEQETFSNQKSHDINSESMIKVLQNKSYSYKPVYVTHATFNIIINSLKDYFNIDSNGIWNDLSIVLEGAGLTIDDAQKFFSFSEHKEMYIEKQALHDITKIYDLLNTGGNNKGISNGTYKLPSYHYNPKCEAMLNDYYQVRVPVGLKLPEEEFKKWFQEHSNLNFSLLNERFKKDFNTNLNLQEIHYKNTGSIQINDDHNISELKTEIISHISKMNEMKNNKNNIFAANVIERLRYANLSTIQRAFRNKYDTDEYKLAYSFHSHKKNIRNLLLKYYKIQYKNKGQNDSVELNDEVLNLLGLNACKKCKNFNQQ